MRLFEVSLVAVLVGGAASAQQDKIPNPGYVSAAELAALDRKLVRIEATLVELQGAGPGYDARKAIDHVAELARQLRAEMQEAWIYDWVEPLAPADGRRIEVSGDRPADPPRVDSAGAPVVTGGDGTQEGGSAAGVQELPADELLEGALSYELDPVFQPDGPYGYLDPIPAEHLVGAELGGPFRDWGGACWASDRVCVIPTELSNRTVVFNNFAASWGDRGPERATREVNVTGEVRGLTYWRPGDWTKGRDGHGFYWNVYHDVTFVDCHVFQGGGQAWQLVFRDGAEGSHHETLFTAEEADNQSYTITLRDCSATDNGNIVFGTHAMSSYPVSIFNPGQSVVIDGLRIRCEFPPVTVKDRTFQSQGGLFLGPGQTQSARCPSALIEGLDIEVVRAGREELVLWAVDTARVVEPRIVDHGGRADVKIVVDGWQACGKVEIVRPQTDLYVHLMSGHPHKVPLETVLVRAGETFVWPAPTEPPPADETAPLPEPAVPDAGGDGESGR
ncbi:MAG: hypothetical protein AAF682_19750 [Planctomycetota bacterium]